MQFRDFTEQDREQFLTMCRDFYSGDAVDHVIPPEHMQRTFDEILKQGPYLRGVMFEEDGVCAGYAQLSFTFSNEAGGKVVWLEEIYTLPQFRGRGIGGAFLDWVRNEYPDVKRSRLEVCESNQGAANLYRRKGYEPLDYRQMVLDRPE